MIDIDPNTASQPQLQATMKALPGVLEVNRGQELAVSLPVAIWFCVVDVVRSAAAVGYVALVSQLFSGRKVSCSRGAGVQRRGMRVPVHNRSNSSL